MGLATSPEASAKTQEPAKTVQTVQISGGKSPLEVALAITSRFEGKGYGQVTGDFDGQGLSVGILQWCFGQGSLQERILGAYFKQYGSIDALGIFPAKVDHLVGTSARTALAYCRATMLSGKDVKPSWKTAWEKFATMPEVIQIQLRACQDVSDRAQKICEVYGLTSLRAYCWAFDIVTQNGSMKDVPLMKPDRAALAAELESMRPSAAGGTDFKKNRAIWQSLKVGDEQVSLLRTTLKRASLGNSKYVSDVVNRKGSIAMGHGHIHGTLMVFPELDAVAPARVERSDADTLRALAESVGLNKAPIEQLIEMRDKKYPDSKPRHWAVVDFSRHSATKRLFVFDVKASEVKTYLVAHGKGSEGKSDDGFADVFSNEPGSSASSLGVYRCAESYQGKHGLSMRLDGLSPTNSNARARAVVLHGADYVSQDVIESTGRIGRSDGCPAVENRFAPTLVSALKDGSLLVVWKA